MALARQKPGQINCGSAGYGTVPHLACETFNKVAGVQVVHIPYNSVNAAMLGVMANQVQMFVAVSTVAKQQIAAGTVRGLAVTTAQRSVLLPQVPTLAESGFPTFVMPGWGGLMAPAGTPKAIVDRINADVQRAVQDPKVAAEAARGRHGAAARDAGERVPRLHQGGHRALDQHGRRGRPGEPEGEVGRIAAKRASAGCRLAAIAPSPAMSGPLPAPPQLSTARPADREPP